MALRRVFDEGRGRMPADEARAAQVGLREPGVPELGTRHDGHLASEEGRVALHVERIGRTAAAVESWLATGSRKLQKEPFEYEKVGLYVLTID